MDSQQAFEHYATRHLGLGSSLVEDYVKGVNNMNYTVIEERPKPFREINVFSRLMMDNIIFLGNPIDAQVANIVVAQMLFLAAKDPKKPITFYINSPGGSVYDGLAIYDTMQYIEPAVNTVCVGLAASMGAVLLASGTSGKRMALPHARIMIHQPLGGAKGQATDMEITIKQVVSLRDDLYKILAHHTGQTVDQITAHADRDYWLRATQAKAYGLIDEVLLKSN